MSLSFPVYRFMRSFRIRIFLAMTLIIVIVIPGTAYFCYRQATGVIERQMHAFTLSLAGQIERRVESFLSHHTFNVRLIKAFFEKGLIDTGSDREILRYFGLFQKDHPEFFNILFADETGRFVMSPPQAPEVHQTFDPRTRPWYRGAVGSPAIHWTDVYLFASTRKPGMTVSVRVSDPGRRLTAVCGIDIDTSSLSRFLQGIKIGSQGAAYIFDRQNGRVIAHPDLALPTFKPFHTDLLRRIHQELSRQNQQSGITRYRGQRYFTAYTDYPGRDWTVGITLPVSDLFDNVKSVRQAIISLVIGGILMASLLSYLIAMTIARPLTRLRQGIERIASGDLAYRVDIRDPDIAAALASAYNQMASSLDTSTRELKRTYAELAQKEKLAAVGQMTAGIAHEIKNPLGIIQGAAQVVANPSRPVDMREKAARFIMEEVEHLNLILTAFLDFAKPPSPKLKPTDLAMVLGALIPTLSLQHGNHRFRLSCPDRLPPILADSDQLRHIFLNLTINAVQSMPHGGTVEIAARSDLDYVTVTVADQGCGIPEDLTGTIFDPFVSFRDKGVGLGLSIVSQIMKTHRGDIRLESTSSRGTTFSLTFPSSKETGHATADSAR